MTEVICAVEGCDRPVPDSSRERHLATAITLRETREYLARYGTYGLAEWLLRRENAYRPDDATEEEMQR